MCVWLSVKLDKFSPDCLFSLQNMRGGLVLRVKDEITE